MTDPLATPRAVLEATAGEIARRLKKLLTKRFGPGVGFCVMLFDFGADGNFAYVSSADRGDMKAAIREWLVRSENATPAPPCAQA